MASVINYKPVLEKLQVSHGSTMLGNFGNDDPWQTLIATILSARSRDETTEVVAHELFQIYPDCASLARAPVRKIEKLVKRSGFYKTKARRIIQVSKILMDQHNGQVPGDMDSLLALPGVGRKNSFMRFGFCICNFRNSSRHTCASNLKPAWLGAYKDSRKNRICPAEIDSRIRLASNQ